MIVKPILWIGADAEIRATECLPQPRPGHESQKGNVLSDAQLGCFAHQRRPLWPIASQQELHIMAPKLMDELKCRVEQEIDTILAAHNTDIENRVTSASFQSRVRHHTHLRTHFRRAKHDTGVPNILSAALDRELPERLICAHHMIGKTESG